jgi:hypothetical protein
MMKPSISPHRGWRCLASLFILTAAGTCLGDIPSRKAVDSSEVVWRSQRMCGVNCLYALLKAYGIRDVSYQDLTDEVMATQADTSLTDIKRAAARRGLRCAIGKTDRSGLSAAAKPVVAHCEQVDPVGVQSGHFVLVVGTDDDGVHFLDGTTAQLGEFPWHEFQRRWSGYIVYADAGPVWPPWAVLVASLPLGLVAGVLVDKIALRRRARRSPAELSPALVPEGSLP